MSSLQTACFIELISLIDVQTQNQTYLSMDGIETTYVNMLGTEGLENHSPSFSRKWLKEKSLAELPHVKSVLQKNRAKPAVLYCPAACEEDLVHSVLTSDENVLDDMKTIFRAAQIIRRSITNFKKEIPADVIRQYNRASPRTWGFLLHAGA